MPYGSGPAGSREHPQGTTILVLGILSLVVCGILGPFAWSMGNNALKEMDAQPGVMWTNRGNVTAGRICGMIASIILIVAAVGFVVLIIGAALANN
jgi:hypothetical protein